MVKDIPIPRYDFYQTPNELILALYIKGYDKLKDDVKVEFGTDSVIINLPALAPSTEEQRIALKPLASTLSPGSSTYRVLGTKIELKLAKAGGMTWPCLLAEERKGAAVVPQQQVPEAETSRSASGSGSASGLKSDAATGDTVGGQEEEKKKKKKNWDKIVDDDEEPDPSDPNAGGDAALQKFFAQIYGNADEDTKRAMIKSFTESGGTTLSTDWSSIGKQTTPVRPPEGVEPRKF
ncbi:hypothetical protein CNBM2140 [Cryptococcus deneoformans B-3501A]|uniref:SGS-domain-containing protein n=1 Tax=Cryptococcus deneoformans (strain JEC21 / ATCC MYA-565) TaxID=214684 RepID=Q5K7I7_CRYD1|nr:conserved hypothetical protein [Cryptococcus neoformans var. neoformans JEC21]XP_772057.1 hypothetical protein CNBM2140 [Cryptococcus neoformans var. neoformans B-3501A]AAW46894.1 conserved hypothetical protein [Cryptococcus neoformans var. neoformans JEC21]EAL17410.1 hypothetical protein CNBM2140 [Cryptococcus neoformans var. neoformans B-3501A]